MKAMILAAGRGKRMRELTDACPKPLLEVAGKPLIVWQLERLKKYGFEQIVINLGYRGAQIEEALGGGSRFGVEIMYSREPEEGLETAGGIIQALPLLSDAPFLVINADVWCDADLAAFASDFNDADFGKLLLVPTPAWKEHGDFGLAEGRVTLDTAYTFAGISVMNPRTFMGLLPGTRSLAPLLRKSAERDKLAGELYQGNWQDVGTPERLAAIENALH